MRSESQALREPSHTVASSRQEQKRNPTVSMSVFKSSLLLRTKIPLNPLLRERIRYLEHFDLSPYTNRAAKQCDWSQEYARKVEEEFRKFVIVCMVRRPGQILCPAADVEELWHALILNTKVYRSFCAILFGCYWDHGTSDGSAADSGMLKHGFVTTRLLLIQVFGHEELRDEIWCDDTRDDCCPSNTRP